ncbi:hypothetical protein M422DRAFT_239711 [Sphaerobolus stellatus SS14]|nr:hypothetical protein M422DRAFT_239711 [Sphaerobolus stellatus SS14]
MSVCALILFLLSSCPISSPGSMPPSYFVTKGIVPGVYSDIKMAEAQIKEVLHNAMASRKIQSHAEGAFRQALLESAVTVLPPPAGFFMTPERTIPHQIYTIDQALEDLQCPDLDPCIPHDVTTPPHTTMSHHHGPRRTRAEELSTADIEDSEPTTGLTTGDLLIFPSPSVDPQQSPQMLPSEHPDDPHATAYGSQTAPSREQSPSRGGVHPRTAPQGLPTETVIHHREWLLSQPLRDVIPQGE